MFWSNLQLPKKEKGIASEAKDNPNFFWNYVNRKTKTKPGIPNLNKSDVKDDVTSNDQEKADILSDFFCSVFTQEDDTNIPILENRNYKYHDNYDYCKPPCNTNMSLATDFHQ